MAGADADQCCEEKRELAAQGGALAKRPDWFAVRRRLETSARGGQAADPQNPKAADNSEMSPAHGCEAQCAQLPGTGKLIVLSAAEAPAARRCTKTGVPALIR